MQYRLAIIEDNANARSNLRSHLLLMGMFEIFSCSNGQELKALLRHTNVDIFIFDYNLGQRRNGADWVRLLRQEGFIKPSNGVIFITSDRTPQTVGKIIDVHPDLLIIKPYSMQSLTRGLKHYLHYRETTLPVLRALDGNNEQRALRELSVVIDSNKDKRLVNDMQRLQARLLLQAGRASEAEVIYDDILLHSDRVLWAQWGKVRCQYLSGQWRDCEGGLTKLIESDLARDKAFEWLASISFEQEHYGKAERYLDNINFSELSVPATKLKTLTFKKQNRIIDGIELLQKKRESNRGINDQFNEFTLELAEFYLQIAEESPPVNRAESLAQAKRLIGIASRSQSDQQSQQKREYMLAHAYLLDGVTEKLHALRNQQSIRQFERADITTLVTAAKVHAALGNDEFCHDLLSLAENKSQNDTTISQQISNQHTLVEGKRALGIADQRADQANQRGVVLFEKGKYEEAMSAFYRAFNLAPTTAAFGVNLLQCMVEAKQPIFRSFTVLQLRKLVHGLQMNEATAVRLQKMSQQIREDAATFTAARPSSTTLNESED